MSELVSYAGLLLEVRPLPEELAGRWWVRIEQAGKRTVHAVACPHGRTVLLDRECLYYTYRDNALRTCAICPDCESDRRAMAERDRQLRELIKGLPRPRKGKRR